MSRSGALLETTLEYVDSAGVRRLTTLGQVDERRLSRGLPVRTIRSYQNQRHRPGLFWSATTGGHVPYESQLELARLWFADFAPDIVWISAQPMWLAGRDDQEFRRHFPDFLLTRSDGRLLVVDVKPRVFADRPKVRATFDWTSRLCAEKGWDFEVWMDYDPVQLSNLRAIAAGRRSRKLALKSRAQVPHLSAQGQTLRQATESHGLKGQEALSLIWEGLWHVDLSRPLDWDAVVHEGKESGDHVHPRT